MRGLPIVVACASATAAAAARSGRATGGRAAVLVPGTLAAASRTARLCAAALAPLLPLPVDSGCALFGYTISTPPPAVLGAVLGAVLDDSTLADVRAPVWLLARPVLASLLRDEGGRGGFAL